MIVAFKKNVGYMKTMICSLSSKNDEQLLRFCILSLNRYFYISFTSVLEAFLLMIMH